MILNEVTQASRMSYVLVQIDPELANRLLAEEAVLHALRPMEALFDDVVLGLVKTLVPAGDGRAAPEQLYAEQAALMLLLTIQRRSAGRSPVVFHKGGLAANQLAKVTDYLLDHPPNDVSLQELATLTSLSPTHLRRI